MLRSASQINLVAASSLGKHFGGRVVAGKVPASLDDLAQPRVDALDGIRRIHHLALQDRLADAAYFLFAWGQPLPGGSMKRANKCMVATNLRSGIAHDHHVRVYPLKRGAIDGRRPLHAPRNDVRRCAKLCQTAHRMLGAEGDNTQLWWV